MNLVETCKAEIQQDAAWVPTDRLTHKVNDETCNEEHATEPHRVTPSRLRAATAYSEVRTSIILMHTQQWYVAVSLGFYVLQIMLM